MFEMVVKSCFPVPCSVRNMVDVVGVGVKGTAKIGDILTDGENKFEVTGIPMLNRPAQSINFDEVNISINTDNPDALVGKTIVAV